MRIPSLQALRKHEARARLPRIAARSAPPSFCASLSQRPAAASQKSDLVYHLMMDCEHLQTPHLDTPTALMERCRSHLVWEVRTDFGIVGVYPRAILRKSDKFSQVSTHPGVDPPAHRLILTAKNLTFWCTESKNRPGVLLLHTKRIILTVHMLLSTKLPTTGVYGRARLHK